MNEKKAAHRVQKLLSQLLAPTACAGADQGVADLRDTPEWKEYAERGRKRAMELGNRGPIRFGPDGELHPEIMESYRRAGFYVFEDVLSKEEVSDWIADFESALENQPVTRRGTVDKQGRQVKFPEHYNMTDSEKTGADMTVATLHQPLMLMDAALRLYGHPKLLRIAESVNGPDFVPHTETIFHKTAGIGPATNWHQDGRTHFFRTSEEGIVAPENLGCHGFSFHGCFSNSTTENGLWVVPGTHLRKHPDVLAGLLRRPGTFDIAAQDSSRSGVLSNRGDIDWLQDAVPMLMKPGDIGMHNRSCLHGSFPNYSKERRLTMQFGFHQRRFVIGTKTRATLACVRPGVKSQLCTYDEEWIHLRTRMIQVAANARLEKYPEETPYVYKPHLETELPWNQQTREQVIHAPYYRIERDGKVISGSVML